MSKGSDTSLTETDIRQMEAGPVLDALCAVAMGDRTDPRLYTARYDDVMACHGQPPPVGISRDWSATGAALEWMADKEQVYAVLSPPLETTKVIRPYWRLEVIIGNGQPIPDELDAFTLIDAPTPKLAIARAVAIIGRREKPDEMQAAWEVLQLWEGV